MKMHVSKLFLLLLVSLSLPFTACNNNKTNPKKDHVKLTTPTGLKIAGTTLTWTAVQNANGYKVDISGTEHNTANAIYALSASTTLGGTYQIRVMAKGDGSNYADSDWSTALSFTFAPNVLYPLPENLEIEIGIFDGTGLELGVITKDVLAYIDQVEVVDPTSTARHYVSYSMTEILAHMGISADFDSALIEASDDPVSYNTTVKSFDDTYIAVVRMTTTSGAVQTTSNFPRFISNDGVVISLVGTITLDGSATDPTNPTDPGNEHPIGELDDFEIEIFSDMGAKLGVITKALLGSITQEIVSDNRGVRYVSYPLTEILKLIPGIPTGFNSAEGEAKDGFRRDAPINDAFIAVGQFNDADEVTWTLRFLPRNGTSVRDVRVITLTK